MSESKFEEFPYGELGIIAMKNIEGLAKEVDELLMKKNGATESYLLKITESRFSNGEGKVTIDESVRGRDILIISDVGNYGLKYNMFGEQTIIGPDEHFQDIKRVISAINGKASRINVMMPLLYASRQHRRKSRESLDCAMALQELEDMGVDGIYTFDVHDPNVQNAIPLMTFENIYPTAEIVTYFLEKENITTDELDKKNMIIISPDTGAMDRAIYYSSVLGVDVGLFYKRRDHSTVINGKNPIVQHEYMGRDVAGKDVLIVDDMIASGESVLDIARELKKRNARNVYVAATFAFFTEGLEKFNKYYEDGTISKIYSTNLTYIPEQLLEAKWFERVDMSEFLARIVNRLHSGKSIAKYMDATQVIHNLLRE